MELRRAAALAWIHDIPLIPHGHLVLANAHLIASQPESGCPYAEYLVRWNEQIRFFFADPVRSDEGTSLPPDEPEIGIEFDYGAADEYEEFDRSDPRESRK